MTSGNPWFFGFLLSDPECQRILMTLAGGFFLFILSASLCLSIHDTYLESEYDLEELLAPYKTLHYSPHGELNAWDGYLEFMRGGTCVGQVHDGVVRLDWHGDKSSRAIELEYEGGDVQKFDCGPMGWQEARKAKALIMRCAGRHAYG